MYYSLVDCEFITIAFRCEAVKKFFVISSGLAPCCYHLLAERRKSSGESISIIPQPVHESTHHQRYLRGAKGDDVLALANKFTAWERKVYLPELDN